MAQFARCTFIDGGESDFYFEGKVEIDGFRTQKSKRTLIVTVSTADMAKLVEYINLKLPCCIDKEGKMKPGHTVWHMKENNTTYCEG